MASPCSPCMCVMGTCSQGWHHWMTSYWRSTHTQSWPGSKVAEASSLLLLILSLYTSRQMAQKRRRKCISHLIYFQFCLDVRIASECNRMQGKSRSAKWMEVVVSSYPHPTQCHHRHLTSFQHLFNSKEKALPPNTVNINVHYRGRCHNCRTLLFTARELRRGSCVQAAAGGQTFQRRGSAQCRQMSSWPTKQCMSPGMWRCEPISYVHCVPELNFSIVITWTKVSLFLFCTEVRTLYLCTRLIPSPNEIEKR